MYVSVPYFSLTNKLGALREKSCFLANEENLIPLSRIIKDSFWNRGCCGLLMGARRIQRGFLWSSLKHIKLIEKFWTRQDSMCMILA